MLCIVIGKDLLRSGFCIKFSDGTNEIGNNYPYPEKFIPYPAVEIPLEDLKAYRDFIDEIIKKHNTDILNDNIEKLGLLDRSYRCLKSENINTISQLINLTKLDILKISNAGKKALRDINECLGKFNLKLKDI